MFSSISLIFLSNFSTVKLNEIFTSISPIMIVDFIVRHIEDFSSVELNIAIMLHSYRVDWSLIIRQCIDTMRNCSPYAVKTDRRV